MGNFFTSVQLRNNNKLPRKQFIRLFCEKMKDRGYDIGDEDNAELSYVLVFSESGSWVSLASEGGAANVGEVRSDAAWLSQSYDTCCINVNVVDSDFAALEMYDSSGKLADTAIVGDASGHMDDEAREPDRALWQPLLTEGSTWEQFSDILRKDSVFVEKTLIELAPLLGMDIGNILFEAEYASNNDENVCFLYFKKENNKNGKKLTLNAAFKQVFGAALEPLGFVKVKSRYPYYVRLIGDEILHIITFKKERYCNDKFDVFGGIATVYRHEIDFHQDIGLNLNWMQSIDRFYIYNFKYAPNTHDLYEPPLNYRFEPDNNASIISAFSEASRHTQMYVLPVLDNVVSLRGCIDFCNIHCSANLILYSPDENFGIKYDSGKSSEGLLYIKIDDHSDMTKEIQKSLTLQNEFIKDNKSSVSFDNLCRIYEEQRKVTVEKRDSIYNVPELYKKVLDELERRKRINIEALRAYGINI